MKMTTGNEKDAASSTRHAATMPTRPHAPVAKTLNRQSPPPPQSILEEGDNSFAKPDGDNDNEGSNEEEEEKLTPFAGDSEEALAPSPPPLSPPPTITDATTSSPSQSTFFPSAPPPPSSPPRHDIDHAYEDHDIHDPPLPSISPPHLQNDPRYRALLSQTLQTALRRERARPSPPTSDLSSCRRALALERRRSLSLALRLAEYELLARYSSCSLHNDMEADEEARMNRIRRWVGRKEREMAEEKGRVVMELEREEERVVNGLMGRLEALRREKEMLEGELRRLGRGGNVGLGGGGAGGMADMGIAGIGGGGSVGIGRSAFGRGLPMTHEGLGRGAQSDEQRLHAQFERMMNVADGPFVRGSRSSVGRSEEVQMNKSGGNSSLNATESQAAVAKGIGDETYVDEGSADVTDCEREETKTQKGCRDDDTTLMGENDDEEEEDDNDQDILEGMHHDPDMEDELEKLLQKKGSK